MSTNYDLDQLMGTYADWIAWLKEKEASLTGQLSRMRGKADGGRKIPESAGTSADDGGSTPAESPEGAGITPAPSDDLADKGDPPSVIGDDTEDWL